MKYVGATNWFIRWPFLLEGMFMGFVGALIAAVALFKMYDAAQVKIYSTWPSFPSCQAGPLWSTSVPVLWLLAPLSGLPEVPSACASSWMFDRGPCHEKRSCRRNGSDGLMSYMGPVSWAESIEDKKAELDEIQRQMDTNTSQRKESEARISNAVDRLVRARQELAEAKQQLAVVEGSSAFLKARSAVMNGPLSSRKRNLTIRGKSTKTASRHL